MSSTHKETSRKFSKVPKKIPKMKVRKIPEKRPENHEVLTVSKIRETKITYYSFLS